MTRQRSDEAERWYSMVYMAVQEIPYGKVTTYGHIARLIGERKPILLVIRHGHVHFQARASMTLAHFEQ